MKNSSHDMKDLNMTKKLKSLFVLWLQKLEVLAFGGLGGVLNSSLATKKLCFGSYKFNVGYRLTTKHWPNQFNGKTTFSGLGETSNISLATEKFCFRQLSEQFKKGVNHQKQEKMCWGKILLKKIKTQVFMAKHGFENIF